MPAYSFLIPAHSGSFVILLSVHAIFAVILLGYAILLSFIPKHNNSNTNSSIVWFLNNDSGTPDVDIKAYTGNILIF